MKDTQIIKEPIAKKVPKRLTIHNDTRIDPYYWMNNREDEEVIQYLNDENTYREHIMKGTKDLQKSLYEEIVGRIKQDDESVPYKMNGYFYYTRFEKSAEYPLICRKKGSLEAEEEIMLNVPQLAKGHSYYTIGGLSISPDNSTIAYGVDTVSRRIYTVYFKNLFTGETYAETINQTSGSATWANDNKTLFFTKKDEVTLRESSVFKYQLGSNSTPELVYEEKDETFNCYISKTKSKQFILISSFSTLTTEYQYLNADNPNDAFTVFQPRIRGLEYSISHYDAHWYIRTNADSASNFKLMKTLLEETFKDNWQELIPHREDVLLEGIEIFKDYLILEERKNGLTQIRVKPWSGKDEHYLDFGEETYAAYIGSNADFDTDTLRYGYSSLTTPSSVIDYNLATREKEIKKETEVVGGYDKSQYQSKRIWATAKDGKKVAISLVYKKGITLNGTNPCLLYAYGSYGYTIDATFSSMRLSLLDRGFVYAIAHIRGSEYMGRHWYEDGKMLHKKNTFTDYITCAEHLVKEKYTQQDGLFAMGGSAGGLLMGAVVNMRPELFKGVIAAVPFVDVVTTMLDESIPLTTGEYDEWGNPNEKKYYDYMLSYSPYDQVKKQRYPAMLITTGLHDSQVQYWEPAKWIAKLRDYRTNKDTPLLLFCNMDTGHGGASGRFESYKESAMEYAFILDLMGIGE